MFQNMSFLVKLVYSAISTENNFVRFAYTNEEMSVIKNLKDERNSFQDHNP